MKKTFVYLCLYLAVWNGLLAYAAEKSALLSVSLPICPFEALQPPPPRLVPRPVEDWRALADSVDSEVQRLTQQAKAGGGASLSLSAAQTEYIRQREGIAYLEDSDISRVRPEGSRGGVGDGYYLVMLKRAAAVLHAKAEGKTPKGCCVLGACANCPTAGGYWKRKNTDRVATQAPVKSTANADGRGLFFYELPEDVIDEVRGVTRAP